MEHASAGSGSSAAGSPDSPSAGPTATGGQDGTDSMATPVEQQVTVGTSRIPAPIATGATAASGSEPGADGAESHQSVDPYAIAAGRDSASEASGGGATTTHGGGSPRARDIMDMDVAVVRGKWPVHITCLIAVDDYVVVRYIRELRRIDMVRVDPTSGDTSLVGDLNLMANDQFPHISSMHYFRVASKGGFVMCISENRRRFQLLRLSREGGQLGLVESIKGPLPVLTSHAVMFQHRNHYYCLVYNNRNGEYTIMHMPTLTAGDMLASVASRGVFRAGWSDVVWKGTHHVRCTRQKFFCYNKATGQTAFECVWVKNQSASSSVCSKEHITLGADPVVPEGEDDGPSKKEETALDKALQRKNCRVIPLVVHGRLCCLLYSHANNPHGASYFGASSTGKLEVTPFQHGTHVPSQNLRQSASLALQKTVFAHHEPWSHFSMIQSSPDGMSSHMLCYSSQTGAFWVNRIFSVLPRGFDDSRRSKRVVMGGESMVTVDDTNDDVKKPKVKRIGPLTATKLNRSTFVVRPTLETVIEEYKRGVVPPALDLFDPGNDGSSPRSDTMSHGGRPNSSLRNSSQTFPPQGATRKPRGSLAYIDAQVKKSQRQHAAEGDPEYYYAPQFVEQRRRSTLHPNDPMAGDIAEQNMSNSSLVRVGSDANEVSVSARGKEIFMQHDIDASKSRNLLLRPTHAADAEQAPRGVRYFTRPNELDPQMVAEENTSARFKRPITSCVPLNHRLASVQSCIPRDRDATPANIRLGFGHVIAKLGYMDFPASSAVISRALERLSATSDADLMAELNRDSSIDDVKGDSSSIAASFKKALKDRQNQEKRLRAGSLTSASTSEALSIIASEERSLQQFVDEIDRPRWVNPMTVHQFTPAPPTKANLEMEAKKEERFSPARSLPKKTIDDATGRLYDASLRQNEKKEEKRQRALDAAVSCCKTTTMTDEQRQGLVKRMYETENEKRDKTKQQLEKKYRYDPPRVTIDPEVANEHGQRMYTDGRRRQEDKIAAIKAKMDSEAGPMFSPINAHDLKKPSKKHPRPPPEKKKKMSKNDEKVFAQRHIYEFAQKKAAKVSKILDANDGVRA